MASIITTQELWSNEEQTVKIETRDGVACAVWQPKPAPHGKTFSSIEEARQYLLEKGYHPL